MALIGLCRGYKGYLGVMGKKLDTIIMGYIGFRV